MKISTLLLSSAAALAFTSAYAADLPSKKAAPADSVKVCTVGGKTGFTLPGSDTCVVLSGYTWAEANILSGSGDKYSAKVREQLNVDTYSNTEMGVLHGNIALRGNQTASGGSDFSVPNAYVQLGGFTAGLLDSTFGYNDGGYSLEGYNMSPSTTPIQVGYSASVGGAKLGVALEEARGSDYTDVGNQKYPDVVGTADFSAGSTSFHIGAVLHDASSLDTSKTGYAFDGAVQFALDNIAKGDFFSVEAVYANGASNRLVNSQYGYDQNNGKTITGYSVGAVFRHVLSANLSATAQASFTSATELYCDGSCSNWTENTTIAGVVLDYQPVKNFHVKLEPYYITNNEEGSSTQAVIRIQRDF